MKYEQVVLVTGDGDFACLVTFLQNKGRFDTLISPNYRKASVLLRKAVSGDIVFLEEMKNRLALVDTPRNEKAPARDQPRT